jgi:hypothetical protein
MNGLYVDANLKDVRPHMIRLLKSHGVEYLSLKRDNTVEGSSWEMACAMSLNGYDDLFSGVITNITPHKISFGSVPAIHYKKKLRNDLKTYLDVPFVAISQ